MRPLGQVASFSIIAVLSSDVQAIFLCQSSTDASTAVTLVSIRENISVIVYNVINNVTKYQFLLAYDERILLMYKKVCRRFVYEYPDTISYYIMEYRKEYDRESLVGTEYEYLLHEDNDLSDEGREAK